MNLNSTCNMFASRLLISYIFFQKHNNKLHSDSLICVKINVLIRIFDFDPF